MAIASDWRAVKGQAEQMNGEEWYQKAVDELAAIRSQLKVLGSKVAMPYGDRESQIASLVQKRDELKQLIEPRRQEIEALRRRSADLRQKAHATPPKYSSVLDLQGEPLQRIMQKCPMVVSTGRVMKYINPRTDWNARRRLYFGMGGGSQNLTRGLPLDAVGMMLTGEVLRRTMGLTECTILCADVITRTNPFPLQDIQRTLEGERDMMQYVIDLLGLEGWRTILHSDLHALINGGEVTKETIFGTDPLSCVYPDYIRILQVMYRHIDEGIARSPFRELGRDARGHEDNWHFALETALTEYLVGNGIHLGWYIPGPDLESAEQTDDLIAKYGRAGLKRMDEEPFDSYHEHTVAAAIEVGDYEGPNRITPVYCEAGIRIPEYLARNGDEPARTDLVERVPPYITYYPHRQILLSDGTNQVMRKMTIGGRWKFGGGWAMTKYWRQFIRLAHILGLPCQGGSLHEQIGSFLEHLNADGKLRALYARTFPKA
ncbi:MAG: hypothetical protein AAB916_02460 [Patescibacteria group bacterium]